jgi:serine O-acetyltransferase
VENLEADLARVGRTSVASAVWAFLVSPGIRAVMLYRLQEALRCSGHIRGAEIVSSANALLTRAEILVGAEFGPGLVIRHPYGIVVGAGVRAGADCTLLHQSTLGEKRADGGGVHVYPTLGDRVTVGVGACVLGGVSIGDDTHIGAGALVLQDVPARSVAVGQPARVSPRSWDDEQD